jgi:hypothetical protein
MPMQGSHHRDMRHHRIAAVLSPIRISKSRRRLPSCGWRTILASMGLARGFAHSMRNHDTGPSSKNGSIECPIRFFNLCFDIGRRYASDERRLV